MGHRIYSADERIENQLFNTFVWHTDLKPTYHAIINRAVVMVGSEQLIYLTTYEQLRNVISHINVNFI